MDIFNIIDKDIKIITDDEIADIKKKTRLHSAIKAEPKAKKPNLDD